MSRISFGDFCKGLGFSQYPFQVYTSELEQQEGSELFVDISIYSPIVEGFLRGGTMLLAGDRGTGKTAILYDFLRKSNKRTLIVNISDYSPLPTEYNSHQLYKFIISRLSDALFSKMSEDKKTGKALTRDDKISLSYYLAHFTHPSTTAQLKRQIEKLQVGLFPRLLNLIYRVSRHSLNLGANATANFFGDLISKSVGMHSPDQKWTEYFPDRKIAVDTSFAEEDASYRVLMSLVDLAKKVGYERVTIIFDKIDEDPRLNNAGEEIADFIRPLVTDNKLLIDNRLQNIVALWVIPFNLLRNSVRTQKIYCPIISWKDGDLFAALDRRLQHFSNQRIGKFTDLLSPDVDQLLCQEMISLSNRNPRDLWHLMHQIFLAQHAYDEASLKLTRQAFQDGFNTFVKDFNFYEYYPQKSNARANSMDVYAYIKHLLKLNSVTFTKNQLNNSAGTGSSTQNYVTAMESMGLIERLAANVSGATEYKIRDPKVIYALNNQIELRPVK